MKNSQDKHTKLLEDNLNKLSKEDIISKYIELNDSYMELLETVSKIAADLESKKQLIRRYNLERFVTKRDNGYEEKPKRTEAEKAAAKARPNAGRPAGSKSFSNAELEEMASKNDPIVMDPAEKLPEDERGKLIRIGAEIGYLLEYRPGELIVKKVIRPKYKKAEEGKEVFLYEPSHAPIPNCIAAPSVLADILMMKYGFGVPHYRYVSWFSEAGFPIDTQTLYRWTAGACDAMKPVLDTYKSRIGQADVVHIDETPIRTLDAEGRLKGYIFVFSCAIGGKHYRYYHFSEDRRTKIVDEVLGEGYKGLIVVDGYGGYDRFSDLGIGVQRCLVHAQRKFKDILKGDSKKKRNKHAERIVKLFQEVFRDEETIRQIGPKTPEERLKLRNDPARSKHVDDLVSTLEELKRTTAEGSELYKAASYFLNDREAFLRFRKDGRAPIDNSEAERTVKPYALARRNFLFVRGKTGGDCSAAALTMIQNAVCNGLDPEAYMRWVLSDAYRGNGDHTFDSPEVPEWAKSEFEYRRPKRKEKS